MAKRGENIRRRKDGRWEGRYIKSRTSEQKPVWGYVYGPTYADVKETLIRKKAEAGFYALSRTDLTFWELAEQWLASIRTGIKESSFAHYQYTLHKYILPVLKNVRVSNLSENILEQAMQVIISPCNQEHRPLGHSSAKECLSMLRRICKYAVHLRLIRTMEICVNLPQKPHKETAPLTPKEQKTIGEFVLQNPTPRKVGLLLGIQLGLRIGELCGLQWGDFDFIKNTLKIQRTVCRICCGNGHTEVVIQLPKTRSSRREIPLPKYLISVLKSIRNMQSDSAYFLSSCEDRPVEPRCYRKSIQCYLKQAKIRLVNPHTLRHTFATTCLQAGCDIKTLSELLGHSNPNITLQRYVHSDLSRKRREIDRIFSIRSGVYKGQRII